MRGCEGMRLPWRARGAAGWSRSPSWPESLLLCFKYNACKVGRPPTYYDQRFDDETPVRGWINNVSRAAYSPNGQLYIISGEALYRGDVPIDSTQNWFSQAQQVGKTDWDLFKFILFHPNGKLYAATYKGELFEGPAPDNLHEAWLYRKAKKVGESGWNSYYALLFDSKGILYAVSDSKFLKRHPPTNTDDQWKATSTVIGTGNEWSNLTHFMGFDFQDNLWCISKDRGRLFKGRPPTNDNGSEWRAGAKALGYDYNMYRILLFIKDRTIARITSLEFMVHSGKILSISPEVVAEQLYDNTGSSVTMDSTFRLSKTCEASHTFSYNHGFSVGVNSTLKVTAGIPIIASGPLNIGLDLGTSHTWDLSDTNTTTVEFSRQFHFEVPPGKAVKQRAVVQKAKIEVPYRAKIRSLYGNETTMSGVWKGVCYFNLQVTQVDA